jgi:hypothetical protein
VAQGVGPDFKPQYWKKKSDFIENNEFLFSHKNQKKKNENNSEYLSQAGNNNRL